MSASATITPFHAITAAQSAELARVNIPFQGCYESLWSSEIDHGIDSYAEYQQERCEHGACWSSFPSIAALPSAIQPDTGWDGLTGLINDHCSFYDARRTIAAAYAGALWDMVQGELGAPVAATFERMTSPRGYNFTTDQIDCTVSLGTMAAIARALDESAEGRAALDDMITRRHTRCADIKEPQQ